MIAELTKRTRRLPHWRMDGAYYFITFNLKGGRLVTREVCLIRDHIIAGHNDFYSLTAVQVMPDHVHLILCPLKGLSVERILKGIKGATARKVNEGRGIKGSLWMEEYYDRIIRSQTDMDEKLNYMYENPLRASICTEPSSYEGWKFIEQ